MVNNDKLYYFFSNNKAITHEALLDYAEDIIVKRDLSDIVNSISIDMRHDSERDDNGHININPNEILLKRMNKKIPDINKLLSFAEQRTWKIKNINLFNIYNLFVISHELTHAYQAKLMINKIRNLETAIIVKDELLSIYDIKYFNNFYYNKYHDYFYQEYNANINSYSDVLYLINSFNIKELNKLLVNVNNIIAKHILFLYSDIDNKKKITTPVKNMKKLYDHMIVKSFIHGQDLRYGHSFKKYKLDTPNSDIERLKLGISINKDNYKYINDIANKKIKTLNLFEDIRKRPNK